MTNPESALAAARLQREESILLESIDRNIEFLFEGSDPKPTLTPIRSFLAHYAKRRKPYEACVRDNMAKLGPGQTEKVCSAAADMLRGAAQLNQAVLASAGEGTEEQPPALDEESQKVLLSIPRARFEEFFWKIELEAHSA